MNKKNKVNEHITSAQLHKTPLRGHRMLVTLYELFEHKCVLEVCVHTHRIMMTIHPVFFLIPILKSPFSNQAVLRFLSEWCSSVQTSPTIVD